jgi:hypothetical protein
MGSDADIATVSGIVAKWKEFTDRWNGMFVRYLDGDPYNGATDNVTCVSPRDAFAHVDDWVVNWPQCLTPQEIQFVLDNVAKFA